MGEYVRAHDVESNEPSTATEWGVEITARLRIAPDRLLTKVFQFRSREEAQEDLETRSKLSFVNNCPRRPPRSHHNTMGGSPNDQAV